MDPANTTYADHRELIAVRHNLLNEQGDIDRSSFDQLLENITEHSANEVVIDTGASTFYPLMNYLSRWDILNSFKELEFNTFIHIPIVAGAGSEYTIDCFNEIKNAFPTTNIILWENEFFGKLLDSGVHIDELTKEKHISSVLIGEDMDDLARADLKEMAEKKLTYNSIAESKDFRIMSKLRIRKIKEEYFNRITKAFSEI